MVDRLGGLDRPQPDAGPGYRFEEGAGRGARRTAPFSVLSTDLDAAARRSTPAQHLHAGLNYVRMRDGILLAATVRLPPGKTLADGPFPTVIEYSGLRHRRPAQPHRRAGGQGLVERPPPPRHLHRRRARSSRPLLGFVTVSVQMRGTGCSGGAFDLFGLPSDYDGYDVVQTVGAQPWVLQPQGGHGRDLLLGVLPVRGGRHRPARPGRHHAAQPHRRPLLDRLPRRDLQRRLRRQLGRPAHLGRPAGARQGGQPWATAEIATGRQDLPGQPASPSCRPRASSRWSAPTSAGRPRCSTRARRRCGPPTSRCPCSWSAPLEDEQMGPQWPALITALSGDKNVYVTMMNGTHIDSLGPDTISRWLEFLDIYVAGRVPTPSPTSTRWRPPCTPKLTGGAPSAPVPAVRFTNEPSVAAAKAAFAAQDPRVRVLFDNGGGSSGRGRCSPPSRRLLVLAPDRHASSATASGPTARCSGLGEGLVHRRRSGPTPPSARPTTWPPRPTPGRPSRPTTGRRCPPPTAIAFETPAFTSATTIVGPASLNLMLRSTAPDHRPAGDRDRGPAGRDAGGVRHLGLPAQQRPHPVGRLDRRSTRCPPT